MKTRDLIVILSIVGFYLMAYMAAGANFLEAAVLLTISIVVGTVVFIIRES